MSKDENKLLTFIYKLGTWSLVTPRWNFKKNVPDPRINIPRALILVVFYIGILLMHFVVISHDIYYFSDNYSTNHFYGFIVVFDRSLQILLASMIILNCRSTKWYEMLELVNMKIEKNGNVSDKKFFKSPTFVHFVFTHVMFATALPGIYYVYVSFENVIDVFIGLFIVTYVMLLYILYLYTCIVFNILLKIRDNFRGILRKECFQLEIRFLKTMQYEYRKNLEVCDMFNEMFGKTLLVFSILATVQLLGGISNGIDFVLQGDEEDKRNIAYMCYSSFLGIISLCYFTSIAFACYLVETEAKKIAGKFSQLWECSEVSDKMKLDLIFLCNYLEHNYPQFTAAGFFSISRGTLSSILATTVTYVIVDVQFRSTNGNSANTAFTPSPSNAYNNYKVDYYKNYSY